MKKHFPCPYKVGDKVRLNDNGLWVLSLTSFPSMKKKVMTITSISDENMCDDAAVYPLEVDDEEINQSLIDSHMFDPA